MFLKKAFLTIFLLSKVIQVVRGLYIALPRRAKEKPFTYKIHKCLTVESTYS